MTQAAGRRPELDEDTLRGCLAGDGHAFRRLVECYQDRVYALCAALAGAADAEDLAQETFLRVHGALRRFDLSGPARLGTYILLIARRLCHDRARGARRRVEVSGAVEAASGEAGAEERLARSQLGGRLLRALAALPEEQRAVIALRAWDGLEYDEIAAVEQVPVGTVRSRLSRARAALRQALGNDISEAAG